MPIAPLTSNKFQFHTGSIKSEEIANDDDLDLTRFNSILVRLKEQNRPEPIDPKTPCFNSILVRLKVYHQSQFVADFKFQFHTGSIKR